MPDNYRALTRTYRPQTFDDIVSQEHVSSTLKNAIKQNRISHAYMFCGPRGVGKTTMARVLARSINNIDAAVDGESLNQTLNVVEIDAASNNKVEDIHHLRETVRIPPQSGKYKIFIVDEVHMLSKQAFNALLKTLEEPPAYAIFIFATTEPHKVLPTILSRVQRFDFKRISVEEIVNRLKEICSNENISIDNESLHVIAKKADGALRDALGLMDQAIAFCGTDIEYSRLLLALNVVGHEQLFQFTGAVAEKNPDTGLNLIEKLMKEGVDIQEFLVSLTEHIRNLYIAKQSERMYLVEATAETKDHYMSAASAFTEEDLMRMLHLVSEAQIRMREVQQPRIHFEILMLKLIHMSRTKELNQLLEGLEQVKKNGSNPVTVKTPAENRPKTEKLPEAGDNSKPYQTPVPSPASENKSTGPSAESHPVPPAGKEPEQQPSNQKKTIPPVQPGNSEEEEDVLTFRPALGFAKGISSENGRTEKAIVGKKESVVIKKAELNGLEDIEELWSPYLKTVKENVPQMLYFQLLRVKLKQLKGTEVMVSADNEFASNLLEENQQLLASLFKQVSGIHLRLKCVVERGEKKPDEMAASPYERFKEIQKKDPHLRTIIELFGAELEY